MGGVAIQYVAVQLGNFLANLHRICYALASDRQTIAYETKLQLAKAERPHTIAKNLGHAGLHFSGEFWVTVF